MDFKKILFRTSEIDVEKALPDAILFCNNEGKIQWVNDKSVEVFETSRMHLLTSNVMDFIENSQNLILNAVASNTSVITKLVGKEIYFDMTVKEIESGYVLAFRDCVNSGQSFELTKKDSNDNSCSMDKFILKIANEFKSPLQSIIGFSQAMSDGLGGEMSEQQEKYIKIINKNSSELMYFVTKLLEFSQTESQPQSPEFKTFDLISSLNSLIRFNEQLYKDRDIKWNISIEDGIKNTIISDESMLKYVVQNVLEVILKSVEMGEISLNVSIPDEDLVKSKNLFGESFVMLSVSSSSLLLSENDLEQMFNPYKIVDTTNRKNLLRAMTLACVKNVVQLLNGMLWVESKILKNTSFNIIIPHGKN